MATATETTVLEAQPRTAGTKNDARRVRREGKVRVICSINPKHKQVQG